MRLQWKSAKCLNFWSQPISPNPTFKIERRQRLGAVAKGGFLDPQSQVINCPLDHSINAQGGVKWRDIALQKISKPVPPSDAQEGGETHRLT